MKTLKDEYKHKGLRKKLIEELRAKGITDESVLAAMNEIPRHFFLDSAFELIAYENRAFPIGQGQTISHPYTVAYQTQLLEVKRNEKVLEIGSGSMYQATVLLQLGAKVFTIERQKQLYDYQSENYVFKNKYAFLKCFYGDGFNGLPTYAPFDKVLVTAAAPFIPEKLLAQLKVGGYMVIPVDDEQSGMQRMLRLIKQPNGGVITEYYENFSFVPMLQGKHG
ncbi:MAG TPA: protein-L-isoaspartate O-methyltransferase [Chitinophagaceae bacterium]|nr:protein-L-isoaspartate O-methyltransferase [Chitinophagaceae bacterium]